MTAKIKSAALAAGFDAVRIASADAIPEAAGRLREFLAEGRHGDMDWMERTSDRRGDPRRMWPGARSAVLVGLNYGPARDPLPALAERSRGIVSVYAKGKDYHDIVKTGLKHVARTVTAATGAEVKVFVDTAPLMEKPLAAAAGLGWQGKHTNLVSRKLGSWLFLGAVLTTAELPADPPERDHCGSCRRCLDICPTSAFPAPYQLDARRCISYLTIEHKGHVDGELRPLMGNRVFGCDDCLAVCPWNKYARVARELRLHPRAEVDNPPLAELLALDDTGFRERFAGTPVKRAGRDRLVRNALIAAGNSGDAGLLAGIRPLLDDGSPLVRAMAVWALRRLATADEVAARRGRHQPVEADADVRREWEAE